jgi:Flp pilus assembly protein TadG
LFANERIAQFLQAGKLTMLLSRSFVNRRTNAPEERGQSPRRRRNLRRGAAVTEFAIIAPLFFMLIIGFIEFGRALMVQQVLINASRVGARQAITTGATTGEVETAVEEYAAGVAVPGVDVSVSPNPATATAGTAIVVTTSVDFANVSWMPAPWFLGGKTLTANSQMRKEGFE